jgi:hypothetical protein
MWENYGFFSEMQIEKILLSSSSSEFLYKELISTGYQIFYHFSNFLYLENCSLQYYGINQGA